MFLLWKGKKTIFLSIRAQFLLHQKKGEKTFMAILNARFHYVCYDKNILCVKCKLTENFLKEFIMMTFSSNSHIKEY